jgi:hypothetical protein
MTIKSPISMGGDFWVKIKVFFIFRCSFGATKFLRRMLSIILRRIFFSLGKKNFFPEAFETICKRQQRFLKSFDV